MGLELIAKVEFLPMVAFWGAMYTYAYRTVKDPKKLQYIEDVTER